MLDSEMYLARLQAQIPVDNRHARLAAISSRAVTLLNTPEAIEISWLAGSGEAGFEQFVFAESGDFRFLVSKRVRNGTQYNSSVFGDPSSKPDYLRVRWVDKHSSAIGHLQFHDNFPQRPVHIDEISVTTRYFHQEFDKGSYYPLKKSVSVDFNPRYGIADQRLDQLEQALNIALPNERLTYKVYLILGEDCQAEKVKAK